MSTVKRERARAGRSSSALWLALPLILLVTTRGDTRDTQTYVGIFESTTEFPWHPLEYYASQGVEWGFGVASWTLASLGLGPRTLFFVISAATFYFVAKGARNFGLNFYAVMPYYLGTFFLTQQLMQIRQGLGIAFAFWVVAKLADSRPRVFATFASLLVAMAMHAVAALPILSALLLRLRFPRGNRLSVAAWLLAIVVSTVACARLSSTLNAVELLERLSTYAADETYSGARSLLEPANLRAMLLLFVLAAARSAPALARSRAYTLLLGLFAMHVGVRLGFLDFEILSGRLSTALGFSEVFLLPLAVRAWFPGAARRTLIGLLYFGIHAAVTTTYQAPFLIDDYLTPLHLDYAAG
jgi:hypothetical protein